MTQYSNPRMDAIIQDWPTGKYRTTAHFWIEQDKKRGERACRTTLHPLNGRESAAKKLTYAAKVRIIDGDDGHTYIAELSPTFGHISIMRGDMKYQHEVIHATDPRYAELAGLFTTLLNTTENQK